MYWVPPTKEEESLETPHRNISYWGTLEELNNWVGSEHRGLGQVLQISWCKSEPKCKKWTDAKKNQSNSYSFMMKNDNCHPAVWRRIPLKVSSALRLYLFTQLNANDVCCIKSLWESHYLHKTFFRVFKTIITENSWIYFLSYRCCQIPDKTNQGVLSVTVWRDPVSSDGTAWQQGLHMAGSEWLTSQQKEDRGWGQAVSLKPCSLLAHLFQLGPSSQRCPLKHHQLNEVFKRVCLREMFHTRMATLPVLAHQFVGESLSKGTEMCEYEEYFLPDHWSFPYVLCFLSSNWKNEWKNKWMNEWANVYTLLLARHLLSHGCCGILQCWFFFFSAMLIFFSPFPPSLY